MKKIADISKYQGNVDWSKTKDDVEFVILRASCGTSNDTRYAQNADGCTKNGIPYHAYHYLKATDFDEAVSEAEVFHKATLGTAPLFYVVDCEDSAITKVENKRNGAARAIVEAFVFELKRLVGDARVGCYIGHHLYKTWNLDYSSFDYVWIPRYGKNSGEPEAKPAYPCDLWQYTSKGMLAGVKGRVDLNQLTGDKPLSYFTTFEREETDPERSETSMFTNVQLAQYCLAVFAAKWVYWYGTCGYECTTSLYKRKKEQYPSHYTDGRKSGYKADIAAGKMCADCVGLIKSFFWKGGDLNGTNKYGANNCPDRSANGMFSLCKETGEIDTIPDIPGLVVWRDGHIGVYVGDGYTIELKGFAYDCVKKKVTDGTWTHWGMLPPSMLTYGDGEEVIPSYNLGDRTLKRGCKGEDVAELQAALVSLGYDCGSYGESRNGIDGDFGNTTQAAVKAMQTDAGIEADGIYGPDSHLALTAMKSAGSKPVQPEDGSVVPTPTTYKLGDRILENGDEGDDVAELQTALVALGYDLGTYGAAKDGVDGDFGKKTVAAVKALQEKAGLPATGIFDTATYKALLDAQNPVPDADNEESTDTPDGGSKPAYVLIVEGKEETLKLIQLEYGGTLAAVDSVVVSQG